MKSHHQRAQNVTLLLSLALFFHGVPAPARDPSGDEIIRNVQQTCESAKTVSARFRQEFFWAMAGESEVSEGTMLLSGDVKFRYETGNELIVSDGVTLWRYNLGSQQVIIENLADADPGAMPRDFLFKFPDQFKPGGVKVLPNNSYELSLLPKDDSMGVQNVFARVDGERWMTTRLSFEDEAGNQTIYELKSCDLNVELNDSSFQFTPPAGATLFDLR